MNARYAKVSAKTHIALQAHRFCPKCGSSTEPVSYGTRRQCTADKAHKQYPRTDPVVIMLVESADGQRALLGRSKKIRMHMQTCLSGFVDQCESIEEVCLSPSWGALHAESSSNVQHIRPSALSVGACATNKASGRRAMNGCVSVRSVCAQAVRREVREEVGIEVGAVSIVGSQPWPIGRGGSCELMIGAVATACSEEIALNTDEVRAHTVRSHRSCSERCSSGLVAATCMSADIGC